MPYMILPYHHVDSNHALLLLRQGHRRHRHFVQHTISWQKWYFVEHCVNVIYDIRMTSCWQQSTSMALCTECDLLTKIVFHDHCVIRRSGYPAVHRNNLQIPRTSSSGSFGISRLENQPVLPASSRVSDHTRLDARSTCWCSVYRGISRPANDTVVVKHDCCQQIAFCT